MASLIEMHEIIPGLWISGSNLVKNKKLLNRNNIKAIVNCTPIHEVANYFEAKSGSSETKNAINYLRIPIDDVPEEDEAKKLLTYLQQSSFDFILKHLQNKHGVLIHCVSGISRSSTTMIYFLMKHLNWSQEYALSRIKEKRPWVEPNKEFWKMLNKNK